ncbi:MAG: GxxExxY protein [Tannerellaceae bacterium]|nr:GxxExxY protein [Tannerellaceae bacterium]
MKKKTFISPLAQKTQPESVEYPFKEETEEIIGCFYKVYRTLGYGFLERVYQNALYYELLEKGFNCKTQCPIKVYYKEYLVGEYIADMIINDKIILELKACAELCAYHEAQLINYLKATTIELGLLLNFGERGQVKRKIFMNTNK